ncbi:hypothetical protein [Roseateles depolymerans]|uniref:Uncharacterized protein n=1 Tax=Roseateles depolymerans TaxID=76731 RepID=A0A0U3CAL1_9BURK|nr:hypothetical protein [Roseateles depolymerans]ALV05800.1 hypothetical protein RD2015_1309 [Roseateles depolymerans]REG12928.1 hypothetical protein DES44_4300 [Roseateles depolymerans]
MDEQPGSNDNALPPAAAPAAAPSAAPVAAPSPASAAAADASSGTASPAAAPAAPWEGPAPDAVAWLLVNWHNKHPLARRIGVQDVHTVGAVALPFLAQPLPKEPSLDAASTVASPEDAPPAKPKRRWPWQRRKAAAGGPRRAWSDVFIPGLKPDAVAAMALDYGFTSAPDELPLRRVEISNSELESGGATQSGAWPMELVLLSAAIDAGPARTRVLVGRRDQVLGKRALDPKRLGAVAAVAVVLLALLLWGLWPHAAKESDAAQSAAAAASAASSASAAAGASSAASDAAAKAAMAASAAASSAASEVDAGESAAVPGDSASAAASAAMGTPAAQAAASAASGAASEPSAAASSATAASGAQLPLPKPRSNGGRPSLQSGVERLKEEQAQKQAQATQGQTPQAPAPSPAPAKDDKPSPASTSQAPASPSPSPQAAGAKAGTAKAPDEAEQRLAVDDAGLGKLINRSAPGAKLVALVGLPQKTKPEAEAQLARMQEMVGQTLRGGGQVLSGAVFQTKEGWRAAVWPFGSREEAQLINATLLARGVRARAVDF